MSFISVADAIVVGAAAYLAAFAVGSLACGGGAAKPKASKASATPSFPPMPPRRPRREPDWPDS